VAEESAPAPPLGFPVLRIDTVNAAPIADRSTYVGGRLSLARNGYVDPFGRACDDVASTPVKVRGRGNTTWDYPKKPLRLKFEVATDMLGMEQDKDWVLLADYIDPTGLRNVLAFELGRRLDMPFTHQARHVNLVLNGTYQGLYLLTEHTEMASNRVVTDPRGGYVVEFDDYPSEETFSTHTLDLPLKIKFPDVASLKNDARDAAIAVEPRDEAHQLRGARRVEVARRLVGHEDRRLADERARDRRALLLAARKLARPVMQAVLQSDDRQALDRALLALRRGNALVEQRDLDVLCDRELADEVERLEHEADLLPAHAGERVVAEAFDGLAIEFVAARGGAVEAAEDVHQRRLARARCAHDRDVLAARDHEVDARVLREQRCDVIARGHDLHAVARQAPLGAVAALGGVAHDLAEQRVRVERLLSALENHGVAALEREAGYLHERLGAAFEDDA
jgi:hypothetical protein